MFDPFIPRLSEVGGRSIGALRKQWDKHLRSHRFHSAIAIADEGLVFGAGAVLARMTQDRSGRPALAVDADKERILCMLMAVLGRPAPRNVMKYVARASEQWSRGEKCLSAIELAFAGLPRLEGREEGFRLFLAEELLEKRFSPRGLMRKLGLDPDTNEFRKDYHPGQPRVAAGNGRESGRWSKDKGSGQSENPSSPAVRVAGDVIHMGTLVGFSTGRVAGEIPTTNCTYESVFGEFSIRYLGIRDCRGIEPVPGNLLP